jgi:hypothetical protein
MSPPRQPGMQNQKSVVSVEPALVNRMRQTPGMKK